jgi:hypothetical protein
MLRLDPRQAQPRFFCAKSLALTTGSPARQDRRTVGKNKYGKPQFRQGDEEVPSMPPSRAAHFGPDSKAAFGLGPDLQKL